MSLPLRVHSFESMGTFDGPGLRLVVFLQGCNFKCLYCANPDTIPIGVGGEMTEAEEVIRRAISEKPFFGRRGGITFSGGEPTVQAKALYPICQELHKNNIHICLDSNGSIMNADVEKLLREIDMVLLDCKEINPNRHKIVTSMSNKQTLATAQFLREIGKPIRLRYVLVPGYTDFEEDLHMLGEHFKDYENIDRVEILPYHTYGKHKYETLGQIYKLENVKEPKSEDVQRARDILEKYFKNVWNQ